MKRLAKLPIKMSAGLGLSMVDRAVKESFAARCASADLLPLRTYFEVDGSIRCFYCDAPEPTRWDHLHAVSRGGDTMPGNLVPACGRCDDSKQDRDVEEWVVSDSRHRPSAERLPLLLARIGAYQQQFAYTSVEFEAKLTAKQLGLYMRFRVEIDALRAHLESEGLLKRSASAGKGRKRKPMEIA